MTRALLICTLALIQWNASYGQYSDQVRQWPQVRLQLSQEVTVSDLFSAGLRPYHRPFAENRNLYAKHAQITIVDRNGKAFPTLPTDIARIKVLKPHLIGTMELWSPPLTINEARKEMNKWLPFIGKTANELNEFLNAVSADWLHYDVVNGSTDIIRFVVSLRDADGLKKNILLMKAWHWETPLVMCFEIETTNMSSRKPMTMYEEPIPPPPGYEKADMKAPKDWEADNPYTPLTIEPRSPPGTLPPKYQAMNDKAQAVASALNPSPTPQSSPKKAPDTKSATTNEEPASTPWLVLAVLIVATIGLAWLVLKNRK